MKKIYSILLVLAGCFAFSACSDNLMELNKGEEELALTVSATNVTLNENNAAGDGITFNWTTGTNKGTNAAISYTLEIDKAGNNFAKAYYVDLGQQVYSLKFTVEDLNEIITKELGVDYNKSIDLEARITATVADANVEVQTAKASFAATTYKPVSSTLYLIGSATPNGFNADNAAAMQRATNGIFTWSGNLNKGTFKFITTLGSFIPSYNRDATSSDLKLIYRSSFDNPDEQFSIDEAGYYTIKVNLLNLSISVVKSATAVPPYSKIWFVGSFSSWNFAEMTQDPANPFIFRYGAVFNWNDGGEFKFATAQGWNNMYHPTTASAPYTWTGVKLDDTGDNKWSMTQSQCGKAYKIALDITPGKESMVMTEFTPYAGIYMVGDATPNGWSVDNATAMTAVDAYTFTWTGNLTAGELKFTCDKQGDWMGAWFMATVDGKAWVEGTENITFVDKHITGNGDIDRKWKVSTAGKYTISLNQLTEKMTVTKN